MCVFQIGALTLKPSAYVSRPWETTEISVQDYLHGGNLVFHLRGSRVIKITGPGWLTDRTRFLYDGFRRQRLVTPFVGNHPRTWTTTLAAWWSVLAERPRWGFRVDSTTGSHQFGWLFKLYTRLGDRRGRPARVSYDGGTTRPEVYHGAYGLGGAAHAGVTLPGGLPHESRLAGPVGSAGSFELAALVVQLVSTPAVGYRFDAGNDPARVARAGHPGRAVFQVSPLQRILAGW